MYASADYVLNDQTSSNENNDGKPAPENMRSSLADHVNDIDEEMPNDEESVQSQTNFVQIEERPLVIENLQAQIQT